MTAEPVDVAGESLSIPEAVERYGVGERTIRRALSAGELPGAERVRGRRGLRWAIPIVSLDARFDTSTTRPRPFTIAISGPAELLTVAQSAQRFDVSPTTLRRLWTAGDLEGAHMRPGPFGDEVVIPLRTLSALFVPRSTLVVGAVDERLRLLGLLEAEQAGREREVRDLTARLEAAERERDELRERLRAPEVT